MSQFSTLARKLDTQKSTHGDLEKNTGSDEPGEPLASRLPPWATRWIGYRAEKPPPEPEYVSYVWSFIGAFCGLSVIQAVFGYASYFVSKGVPPIIPSYGASAVLCYGAIAVPLAQPRALLGGHFFSALVGVIISVIFDSAHHPETHWVAASLATAIAIVVMQFTKTTHPPAGATALIPVVDAQANALGWYYLPVVLLSSSLILVTALITNNIQRRYPTFWFTPVPIPAPSKPATNDIVTKKITDSEERSSSTSTTTQT